MPPICQVRLVWLFNYCLFSQHTSTSWLPFSLVLFLKPLLFPQVPVITYFHSLILLTSLCFWVLKLVTYWLLLMLKRKKRIWVFSFWFELCLLICFCFSCFSNGPCLGVEDYCSFNLKFRFLCVLFFFVAFF